MKTKNNKLDFKTKSIVELNDNQLHSVEGGTSPILTLTRSSRPCLAIISITVPTVVTE